MRFVTTALLAAMVFGAMSSAANAAAPEADRQAVDAACSTEATTAKCGSEKVGSGLLRCLHAYKKANPTFQFSDACKTAMKQLRSDRKSAK